MGGFAERMGLRAERSLVQSDSLDDDTRIELWNITHSLMRSLIEARPPYEDAVTYNNVTASIWAWEFKRPRDEQPNDGSVWGMVKNQILKASWGDALDLIEATIKHTARFSNYDTDGTAAAFVGLYNNTFEIYLVGFRFIDLKLMPLDSEVEVGAVSSALEDAKTLNGARHHLQQAATLLSDRKSPDYPNSIKESISAVESVCVAVTNQQTLGEALRKLKDAGVTIHPALEGAWSKMYGWTSDADGIRHGTIEAPDADQALAKYMLVACSAFVSLVMEAGRKAKLI